MDVCENASTLGHECGLTGSRSPRSRGPYSALCEPPTLTVLKMGNPATRPQVAQRKERGAFGGKQCCARGWVAHTGLSRWVRLHPLCSLPVPPSSLLFPCARLTTGGHLSAGRHKGGGGCLVSVLHACAAMSGMAAVVAERERVGKMAMYEEITTIGGKVRNRSDDPSLTATRRLPFQACSRTPACHHIL